MNVPPAFERLHASLASTKLTDEISRGRPLTGGAWAAVLIALSNTPDPDIIFTERSHALLKHPGQISVPGGRRDEGDDGPAGTALREAQEEVGLDPASITLLGNLPAASVPVSRYDVVGVVGYWDGVQPLRAVDLGEVASVHRWSVSMLADPANRIASFHPSGHVGPAWQFDEFFLWGFTGYIVEHILRLGGWEQPWDTSRVVEVPRRFRSDRVQMEGD